MRFNLEQLFSEVQDEHVRLKKCHYRSDVWHVTYQLNEHSYHFRVCLHNEKELELILPRTNNRYEMSQIAHSLIIRLTNFPAFKLKLSVFHTMDFLIFDEEELVMDLERYEERKDGRIIKQNEDYIKQSFYSSLDAATPDGDMHVDLALCIRDEEEIPLMHFLLKEGLMKQIVSINGKAYVGIDTLCNRELFFYTFAEKMDTLGYNLFIDSFSRYEEDREQIDFYSHEDTYYDYYESEYGNN